MSIFERVVHVSADGGRAGTQRVQLPLAARAGWLYGCAGLAAGLVAAGCLGLGVVLLVGDTPVFGLLILAIAVIPSLVACTAANDLSQRQPVVIVKADGILDRRLGREPIFWEEVADAEIVRGVKGVAAVRLRLVADAAPAYNPCRFGAWRSSWRDRRRTRTVPLLLLDVRPHLLAHTVLALIARNRRQVAGVEAARD